MSLRATAPRSRARILRSEVVYQGSVFGVRRDEVIEPGGLRATREIVTHPGSVATPSPSPPFSTIFVFCADAVAHRTEMIDSFPVSPGARRVPCPFRRGDFRRRSAAQQFY